MKRVIGFILSILILLSYGCGSGKEAISPWQSGNMITIDGKQNDWENKLTFDSDEQISYGFANDNDNLYICVVANNRSRIFQMLRMGFTIWFESPNNDSKTIGVKYPIGERITDRPEERQFSFQPDQADRFEERFNKLLERETELLILNKEKFPLTAINPLNDKSIVAKIGLMNRQLVYELKIPLRNKCSDYCVDVNPGEKIKILFQSELPDPAQMMNRPMRRGNQPDVVQPDGRRPMGGRQGNRPETLKPLNMEIKVTLQKDGN